MNNHTWNKYKIASIQTMLRFFLALSLLYRDTLGKDFKKNIICICYELLNLFINYPQLNIRGLFQQFTNKCIGNQLDIKDFLEVKWNTRSYRYRPENIKNHNIKHKTHKTKKHTKHKTKKTKNKKKQI